jgi:hypothetical protein
MKFTITNRFTGSVMFELEADSFTGANLAGANLNRADLNGANLTGANLYRADLAGADLTAADLAGANLTGANLYRANLTGANLAGANLYRANLTGANLAGANLNGADLNGADLWPNTTPLSELLRTNSVVSLLSSINWGQLPDDLTLEMMRHDAESCGDELMTAWADGGRCPFSTGVRDYLFTEHCEIWKPGTPKLKGRKLLEALWVAKGGKI